MKLLAIAALRPALLAAMLVLSTAETSALPSPHQSPAASMAPAESPARLPADLPLRRDKDAGLLDGGTLVVALLLVGGVGLAMALALRRGAAPAWMARFRPMKPPLLEVLSSASLGSSGSLQLVRWGDELLLLGCAAQSITVLGTRPAQAATVGTTQAIVKEAE